LANEVSARTEAFGGGSCVIIRAGTK